MLSQTFQGWTLDKDFASALDEGWNLEIVREAAYRALASVGRERMHFRPPEEQNSHKITCGVLAEVVEQVTPAAAEDDSVWSFCCCTTRGLRALAHWLASQVTSSIESSLSKERVVAQQLVSGSGKWRALDIVAKNSSTPSAIQCVRLSTLHSTSSGIPLSSPSRLCGNDHWLPPYRHIRRKLGFSTSNTVAFCQNSRDFHGLAECNHVGTAADRPASELGMWLQNEKAR